MKSTEISAFWNSLNYSNTAYKEYLRHNCWGIFTSWKNSFLQTNIYIAIKCHREGNYEPFLLIIFKICLDSRIFHELFPTCIGSWGVQTQMHNLFKYVFWKWQRSLDKGKLTPIQICLGFDFKFTSLSGFFHIFLLQNSISLPDVLGFQHSTTWMEVCVETSSKLQNQNKFPIFWRN